MGAYFQGTTNRTKRAESDFSGGINNEQDAAFLDDNELSDMYGFDFDHYPDLTVRAGRAALGASPSRVPNMIGHFAGNLLRVVDNRLERWDGSTWQLIGSMISSAATDWTTFEVGGNPAIILTNGIEVRYWDGTTFDSLGGSPPPGKYITNDVSRVFLAKGDVIHWCGFQDVQDWSSAENSGFAQYYTAGGGDITAVYNYKDVKYLWKKDSMAGMYGTSYFDFRIMEVSNNIGCVNARTVAEVNGILFWLGRQDIYAFTQGNPNSIGNKVRGFFKRINWAAIATASAFTDGLRYYLNLPLDSATSPNIRLIYDTRYGRWRVAAKDEQYQCGTTLDGAIYALAAGGRAYHVNVGTTDDGSAIPWSLTSKAFDEGAAEAEKEYKELHLQGLFGGTVSAAVSISTAERGESFTAIPYDPLGLPAAATNKNLIIPLDATDLTSWFRFRVAGSGPASLYKIQRYFRYCRVQR